MASTLPTSGNTVRVRIWDAPVRIIHWSMVVLIAISWRTAETGEMVYHQYSGYALLGLLCFRIYWGFCGSPSARFASFIRGPRTILEYVKQLPSRVEHHEPSVPGHNPLGALSVIALLALVLTQIGLGLFAVDVDGIESGPLSMYVSFDAGRACARWHEQVFDVLVWFIGMHVAAVLFYLLYKRQNLIASMLHGRREYPDALAPAPAATPALRLIAGIVISCTIVWLVARAFQF